MLIRGTNTVFGVSLNEQTFVNMTLILVNNDEFVNIL